MPLAVVAAMAGSLLVVSPAGAGQGSTGSETSGPRVRLVVLTDGARQAPEVAEELTALAPEGLAVVDPNPAGRTLTVELPEAAAQALTQRIEGSTLVDSVVPETTYSLFDVPNDKLYDDQSTSLKALKLPSAWTLSHGSHITIAVVDSGVAVGHPDLAGKVVDKSYNAPLRSDSASVTDSIGHGTAVASMAAASTNNNKGVAGTGWNAKILAVKVANSQEKITNADLADGIDWAATHGADVINLSLGSGVNDLAVKEAVARAVAADIVVVAAAGNSGGTSKFYPAALPGVLAVGATTASGGSRANFSQHGDWVDVGAPGVHILGANHNYSTESDYVSGDGTSFASPLVAGIAALVRASRPDLDQAGVRKALTATAGSKDFGFHAGLVNAYAALGYTLDISGPAVTQPTPGAVVSGEVAIHVNGVEDGVTRVRAFLIGRGPSVGVDVVGGEADLSLPTAGSAGAQTIRVVGCQGTTCSAEGTDVPVNVDNEPPVITSPDDGLRVTEDFEFAANSTSPAVRFVADGTKTLGTDLSAPFSISVAATALTPGAHSLTVVPCDAAGKTCATNNASDAVSVTVAHLSPTIASLKPNPFSPDRDGRKDSTTLSYRLDVASTVTITVRRSSGKAFTIKDLGAQSKGAHSWTWKGKGSGGTVAQSGKYSLELHTSASVSGEPLAGDVSRTLHIDKKSPKLTDRSTTYRTVYPVKDGYRDSSALSVTVSESTKALTARVVNSAGHTVWSKTRSGASAGTKSFRFNGRKSSGAQLPTGSYQFSFTAIDPAGNKTTSKKSAVKVSAKRLSKARTASRTLTAEASFDYWSRAGGDTCSSASRSSWATGAVYWNSCGGLVLSRHHLTLPKAPKYGWVQVSTYARGSSGAVADLRYIDERNDVATTSHLHERTGDHRGKKVSLSGRLLKGQKLRWDLRLQDGDQYEAKTFTVSWTYYALI